MILGIVDRSYSRTTPSPNVVTQAFSSFQVFSVASASSLSTSNAARICFSSVLGFPVDILKQNVPVKSVCVSAISDRAIMRWWNARLRVFRDCRLRGSLAWESNVDFCWGSRRNTTSERVGGVTSEKFEEASTRDAKRLARLTPFFFRSC